MNGTWHRLPGLALGILVLGILVLGILVLGPTLLLAAGDGVVRESESTYTTQTPTLGPEVPAGLVLKGNAEGTDLESVVVEGEDRISITFDRPALDLDLNPRQAPGLEWQDTWQTLDLFAVLARASAFERSPFLGRPWLQLFAAGEVARFRPKLSEADRWQLTVVDSRGQEVRIFADKGDPPEEIVWDGLSEAGEPVLPGLTYSFLMETQDRAGNRRSFVSEGFTIPPLRHQTAEELRLIFSGEELIGTAAAGTAAGGTPPLLLEAASWLNQGADPTTTITIATGARTATQANDLARQVAQSLRPWVLGDPARIQVQGSVQPDAPDHGFVAISLPR